MTMLYVFLIFFSNQICSSWQNEALDVVQSDYNFLNNEKIIPWLALLVLSKRDEPVTEKRTPLAGQWKPAGKHTSKTALAGKQPRPSVFEGRATEINYFPWHAQVFSQKKDVTATCGGVIASNRIVITAAHCVVEDDGEVVNPKHVHVLLGSSYLNDGQKYRVCKISEHPGYLEVPYSYYYDMALILLRTRIRFDRSVQPARIITNSHWRDTRYSFNVVGFGATSRNVDEDYQPKSGHSKKLHKTRMRYVDSWKCNESPSSSGKGKMPVPPHMFCMIGERKSDCYGDSGSGVMWADYVVGLVAVSRGKKCGSTNIPSMYNDLNSFGAWIRAESRQLEAFSRNC